MKLNQILNEGVVVHGNELLAYVITIAEIYAEKPRLDKSVLKHWESLVTSTEKLAKKFTSGLDVVFTKDDPYSNINDMIADMVINKRLKIFKTDENKHPVFTDYQNDLFRALHDAATHVGGNVKNFKKFMKGKSKTKIAEFDPLWGNSFNVRGEMNTFIKHSKTISPIGIPALFTEIVGQISTYFVTGDFTDDKVAILDGVDFKNVGVLKGKRQERMNELLAIINDDSVDVIKTKVKGITLHKNKIKWKLLSKGTGAGNR